MPLKKNIVKKGGKTIIIKTQQKDKFCLTVLLTITADESKLPPFLIFKGKPNGTIEKELSKDKYALANKYFIPCNSNAWSNDDIVQKWFFKVWLNYINKDIGNNPEGDYCLILDQTT